MNKTDLIAHLAEEADINKKQASLALESLLLAITESLAQKEDVTLIGLGTFKATERTAREGRNPSTGESIHIAASTVVRFKPGKNLKDTVNH